MPWRELTRDYAAAAAAAAAAVILVHVVGGGRGPPHLVVVVVVVVGGGSDILISPPLSLFLSLSLSSVLSLVVHRLPLSPGRKWEMEERRSKLACEEILQPTIFLCKG